MPDRGGDSRPPAGERPRLNLKPRTLPLPDLPKPKPAEETKPEADAGEEAATEDMKKLDLEAKPKEAEAAPAATE